MTVGMAIELAHFNVAANTLDPVEAVASVGAVELGVIDCVAHMEPAEAMAGASLALCLRPAGQLSGRIALSLPLLRELGATVHRLAGRGPLPDFSL